MRRFRQPTFSNHRYSSYVVSGLDALTVCNTLLMSSLFSGIFGYINYLVEKDRKYILDTLVNGLSRYNSIAKLPLISYQKLTLYGQSDWNIEATIVPVWLLMETRRMRSLLSRKWERWPNSSSSSPTPGQI